MSEIPPTPSSEPNDAAVTRAVEPTFVGQTHETPAPEIGVPPVPVIQVEGYRILHEISRGGQAIVYCAQFLKTGRRVAVKVMREGPLATESGRARFTREAQILASLNHPNIVTILDRGRTADGTEYFTMDYIDGHALDEGTWKMARYMERAKPNPSMALQLFLKICDAVNAAHLRGIVHRDLKPSNVRLDERGEPHVLDFGLARGSMAGDTAGSTEPVTITGQFLGSLPWASPEQAEGVGQKIDMRSDVYSLGVILYQLMTGGTFPYQVVGSMRDVLNNIMTAKPPAPSQVLSERESRDAARRIRRVGPESKLLNSALDAIILKSLAKRRDDRYQSAGELARDIEAYLAGRPLQASGVAPAAKNRKMNVPAIAIAAIVFIGLSIWAAMALMRGKSTDGTAAAGANSSNSTGTTVAATPAASPPAGASVSASRSLPAIVLASPLKQEYQDLETIMNRFLGITSYIHTNAPSRFVVWRDAAEKDDAVGQLLMARCYEYGEVVNRNVDEGSRYMRLAADQKLPMALCLLGIRYRASLPPIQDYPLAIKWYKLAAEGGSARAMIDLGIMYSKGQGGPVDIQAALKLLQQAADLGAPAAYAMLGDIYRTPGNGVTDPSRAMEMYKRAVNVGAPNGYLSLGQMYASGSGVPRDFAEAMRLLQRADADGVFGAAEGIGDLYFSGSGVKQDYEQAAKWYQKAANMSAVSAMRKLAALYEHGRGVSQDRAQATAWYTKAATAGDSQATKWLETNAKTVPVETLPRSRP